MLVPGVNSLRIFWIEVNGEGKIRAKVKGARTVRGADRGTVFCGILSLLLGNLHGMVRSCAMMTERFDEKGGSAGRK